MQDWRNIDMIHYRMYEDGLLINEGYETTDGRTIEDTLLAITEGMSEEEELEYNVLGTDEALKMLIMQLKDRLDDLDNQMNSYLSNFLQKTKFTQEIYELNKSLKDNLR